MKVELCKVQAEDGVGLQFQIIDGVGRPIRLVGVFQEITEDMQKAAAGSYILGYEDAMRMSKANGISVDVLRRRYD